MKVEEIMHKVLVIEPDTSIHEVARLMSKNETGSVLVKNGTRTGILTETDILRKVVAQNLNPNEVKAKDIMTGSCFTINSDADLEDASDLFNKRNIRRLPIVKEGKIVGIITTQEVAKNLKYALLKRRREYSDEIGGEHSLRR
ncbi:MAG: CBS domain-containing protein [Candidatus Altiarchaeales archaeon]|nr:CBS domain-containing protein [Candidatus Altiarchaeota archaeon]MBU4341877.1 CBS domain-containing protein [Candidatus Altiarchaeota archaeon]MBU4407055.1 CBS domain-containing protein [Candidatus Altiarchaeota archaeon]MBU4436988.1 CBS domain-containing protein [Candidatus Altiarchaeota archaeon]MCG2783249.1 CBS domain-containing protein [Candidatus Altiarchaeales archaeon]